MVIKLITQSAHHPKFFLLYLMWDSKLRKIIGFLISIVQVRPVPLSIVQVYQVKFCKSVRTKIKLGHRHVYCTCRVQFPASYFDGMQWFH